MPGHTSIWPDKSPHEARLYGKWGYCTVVMALKPLDYANLGWIWMRSFPHTYRRWQRGIDSSGVSVFYGFDHIPSPDEKAAGGIIKIQDLESIFPNRPSGANVLYLVSSALPYFAVRMARMAHRAGATVILNQNGVAYPGWFGKGWRGHNRPMQRLLLLSDHVIYQSRFCKFTADRFLGKPKGSWEILYNPVDTRTFRPPGNEHNTREAPRLLIAGSHWSYYRPKVALETLRHVLKKHPGTRLTIAGRFKWEDDETKAHQRLIEDITRMGISGNVDVRGSYSQVEAIGLLQGADLLLHTKYNDPCPRLVVEAMACGLPIVYSATGGVPELVGENGGIGIPGRLNWERDHPPAPRLMAEAALKILDNPEKYAAAARKRAVARFDRAPWLARHVEIFQRFRRKSSRWYT